MSWTGKIRTFSCTDVVFIYIPHQSHKYTLNTFISSNAYELSITNLHYLVFVTVLSQSKWHLIIESYALSSCFILLSFIATQVNTKCLALDSAVWHSSKIYFELILFQTKFGLPVGEMHHEGRPVSIWYNKENVRYMWKNKLWFNSF